MAYSQSINNKKITLKQMKEHYHHFNATKTITEYVKGKSKMQKVKKKDILQKIVRQAQRK